MVSRAIAGLRSKIQISRAFSRRRHGRLIRDYFLISILLIATGLSVSAAVEIYFRYFEARDHLALLQQESATVAAVKIDRFIQDIETAMKAAAKGQDISSRGIAPDYNFELKKLLFLAPAISEAVVLDAKGTQLMRLSRLQAVFPEIDREFAGSELFLKARRGQSYFGQPYLVHNSEPYITIAIPIEHFRGRVIGVLKSEVNLKYVWEVVSAINPGRKGYAYAVSSSGNLIAHPDISLVLQGRNLSQFDQVRAVFRPGSQVHRKKLTVARNLEGKEVITSYALIPRLGWAVFIERPVEEAYETLYASVMRTSTLLLVGLGMALFASVFVARRVVTPLKILRDGVQRIGGGDLRFRVELKTGDEIEALADEFNKMTTQLDEAYANLEQRVEQRTQKLTESLEQQTTTAEVLDVMARSPNDPKAVLDMILKNSLHLCRASYGSVFTFDGKAFHLAAITEPITPETAAYLKTPIPPGPETPLRRVALELRPIQSRDIINDPQFSPPEVFRIEGIRTTISVPLLKENELVGVIDIHRREIQPFTEREIELLTTFANEAAIAIENVRLFQEIQEKNRQLEFANERLKELDQLKSDFVSNVSHELRTPLTAIKGCIDLLLREVAGTLNEKQTHYLARLRLNTGHLAGLINDLLDISKIEAGKMELKTTRVSLGGLVHEVVETLRPLAAEKSIMLETTAQELSVLVWADRGKVTQVLMNLIGNALKFTPANGRVRVSTMANGKEWVQVSIEDTGPGVATAEKEKIFEKFYQVAGDGKQKPKGTGLGLAISKSLVELHGGKIWVESELSRGSTFIFILPAGKSEEFRRASNSSRVLG